jgi:hypothetical protein
MTFSEHSQISGKCGNHTFTNYIIALHYRLLIGNSKLVYRQMAKMVGSLCASMCIFEMWFTCVVHMHGNAILEYVLIHEFHKSITSDRNALL